MLRVINHKTVHPQWVGQKTIKEANDWVSPVAEPDVKI